MLPFTLQQLRIKAVATERILQEQQNYYMFLNLH
jgi:hypothetical protein